MKLIDYSQIRDNILRLKAKNDLILVLKDNAYGFGLSSIVDIAASVGVLSFAVKNLNEAMIIKKKYVNAFVLLLGIPPKTPEALIKYDLTVSVGCIEDYLYFSHKGIKMHIEIDVGMNRFGFKSVDEILLDNEYVTGLYFHSPIDNKNINLQYINKFSEFTKYKNLNYHIGGSSLTNIISPYSLRIGKCIYDKSLSLYGKVISIKKLYKGDSLGYDMKFYANSTLLVGVVNIGYVNGISRKNNGQCYVYVGNRKCPIIGNKCMDQCFIQIDDTVKVTDDVEFLGNRISIEQFAYMNDICVYEAYLRIK